MNTVFYIICEINELYTIVFSGVFAIIGYLIVYIKKREWTKYIIRIICASIVIFIFSGIFEKYCLREVPDLYLQDYMQAQKTVEIQDLIIEDGVAEDGYIVVRQNPKAGTIVLKNSEIEVLFQDEVELKDEEMKKISRKMLEKLKNNNIEFQEISFSFNELQIATTDSDMEVRDCIGIELSELEGLNVKFVRKGDSLAPTFTVDSKASYIENYNHNEASYVFGGIPYGDYEIYITSDDYKSTDLEVSINDDLITNSFSISLVNKQVGQFIPCRVYILDQNMNGVMCHYYNLRCSGEEVWGNTESEQYYGETSFVIFAYSGARFDVRADIGSGILYEGVASIEKPGEDVYMVIESDGILHQISQEEYMKRI